MFVTPLGVDRTSFGWRSVTGQACASGLDVWIAEVGVYCHSNSVAGARKLGRPVHEDEPWKSAGEDATRADKNGRLLEGFLVSAIANGQRLGTGKEIPLGQSVSKTRHGF